ncbi:MAG: hypothetical protein ACLQE9_08935 [Roseiarcus sp.]
MTAIVGDVAHGEATAGSSPARDENRRRCFLDAKAPPPAVADPLKTPSPR